MMKLVLTNFSNIAWYCEQDSGWQGDRAHVGGEVGGTVGTGVHRDAVPFVVCRLLDVR